MAKKISIDGLEHYKSKENAMIASAYDATKTYAVGDYAYNKGTLYKCTTPITTAEAWTAGHWTAAKLADDLTAQSEAIGTQTVTGDLFTDSDFNWGYLGISSVKKDASADQYYNMYTNPVAVEEGEVITVHLRRTKTQESWDTNFSFFYVFCNSTGAYTTSRAGVQSRNSSDATYNYLDTTITVPSGEKYMMVSWRTNNELDYSITGLVDTNSIKVLQKDVLENTADIETNATDIASNKAAINHNVRYDFDNLKPFSIAHRGYYSVAPQNTLPAFRLAKSKGFDFIEADLAKTSDGVYVFCHDDDITTNDRARNADGTLIGNPVYISESTYAELLQYDFGIYMGAAYAGTKIPTFEEVVELCKEIQLALYLDVKSILIYEWTQSDFEALMEIAKNYGMGKNIIFASPSYTALGYIKAASPTVMLGAYAVESPTSTTIDKLVALKTGQNRVFHATEVTAFQTSEIAALHDAGLLSGIYTPTTKDALLALDTEIDLVISENYSFREVLYEANIGDPDTGLIEST